MKEFEMSLGGKFDKEEIKRIIKEREAEGYYVMSPQEAERFYKEQKIKNKREERAKDGKNIEKLLKSKGFI